MTAAPFPLLPGKHALGSATDPREHTAYLRAREPDASLDNLGGVILLYQRSLLRHVLAARKASLLDGWVRGDLWLVRQNGRWLGLCGGFGLGAPAAALVLEQLIALGITRVITVGTAAALQPDLCAGDLVVCTQALRDEGLSHHYLAPSRYAHPSGTLTDHLTQALQTADLTVRRGPTWSTDALYRETHAEIAAYSAAGILTADMEAAGVFAVAEHRDVNAAALFAVADSLLDRQPRQDPPATRIGLLTALDTALTALAPGPRSPRRPTALHYGEASPR
ncbi:nucleoside phosphorylase [Streptomyces cinnamoneus]|uniref:nucleoside phosphorylase n=1 Tax=Streptomyces cinnamoneus TaxID=53446 RepID=UPI0033F040D2